MVRIALFTSFPQAQAMMLNLQAAGIHCHLDGGEDGLILVMSQSLGGIGLWVPESQADEAIALLQDWDESIETLAQDI